MALKDLLVYLDQSATSARRLRLALDLARRHDCRVTALFVRELSPAQMEYEKEAELGLASGPAMERVEGLIEGGIDQAAARLQTLLHDLGREHAVITEWRDDEGPAAESVPEQARYADLCVLGQGPFADRDSVESSFVGRMPFVTGAPVLLVPVAHGPLVTLGRHVAIAWNGSRVAARAVNDALPLIERADRTTVFTVGAQNLSHDDGGMPQIEERMVEHLRRHTPFVDAARIRKGRQSVAEALFAAAAAVDADVLVAGAYGHAHALEMVFGGVTRELLARMSLPLLLSH